MRERDSVERGEKLSEEGGRRRKIMGKEGKEIVWGGERKENESREEREIGKMKGGGRERGKETVKEEEEEDKVPPVQSC